MVGKVPLNRCATSLGYQQSEGGVGGGGGGYNGRESGRRDNNAGGADDVTERAGGDGGTRRAEWLQWQGIPEGHGLTVQGRWAGILALLSVYRGCTVLFIL